MEKHEELQLCHNIKKIIAKYGLDLTDIAQHVKKRNGSGPILKSHLSDILSRKGKSRLKNYWPFMVPAINAALEAKNNPTRISEEDIREYAERLAA